MKLKWWHKALAKDLVLARMDYQRLAAKYTKFGCKVATIKRLEKDYEFQQYCEKIDAEIRDEVIKAKMRLNSLASGQAIDVLEEELNSIPWNPETGDGDKNYNKKIKVDTAKDLIKISDVGQQKDDIGKPDVVIKLVTDAPAEIKKEMDEEGSDAVSQPKTAEFHRD